MEDREQLPSLTGTAMEIFFHHVLLRGAARRSHYHWNGHQKSAPEGSAEGNHCQDTLLGAIFPASN